MSNSNSGFTTGDGMAFLAGAFVLFIIIGAIMVNVVNQRETQRGREQDRIEACATLEDSDQRLTCLVGVGVRK